MTKAIYHKLLLLAALPALLLAASCSNDDLAGTDTGSPDGQIRFEIGFAPPPSTRVATDTKYNTTWEDGDAIGIFAVEHGTALAAANNPIHNAKLTYNSANGGTWTTAEPLYWPMDGKKLDFYAYYPYDQTQTDPLKIAFSVPKDQRTATPAGPAYNRHDLLIAKTGTGSGKGETVPLDFSHALAMVEVNVSKSMIGDYAPDALIVRLDGCTTACVLDLSTQSATQPSGAPLTKTIKMYPCPNDGGAPGIFAYRAVVPAQTIAAGTVLFSFEHDGGNTLLRSQPLAQELTLAANRAETFDMTFPFTSVTVSDTERLIDLLTGDKLTGVTHLKVFGEMTEADFSTIRKQMPSIVSLDLGGATVKGDSIPDHALEGKTGLQEFIFPRGITVIDYNAFAYCSGLTGSLTIPEGVQTIGQGAFVDCTGFTGSLTIPASVTTISKDAFRNCSGLTGSLTIPGGVETIGEQALGDCSGFNGTLTISEGVKTIGDYAFSGCNGFTNSLTIPKSVTTIGNSAFYGCNSFTDPLTIPKNVTTIGNYAFQDCKGFTGSLTIPEGVTNIGWGAFGGCTSLSSITCHIPDLTKVTFGIAVFENIPRTIPVYVPSASVTAYKNHDLWDRFSNIQPIPQP